MRGDEIAVMLEAMPQLVEARCELYDWLGWPVSPDTGVHIWTFCYQVEPYAEPVTITANVSDDLADWPRLERVLEALHQQALGFAVTRDAREAFGWPM